MLMTLSPYLQEYVERLQIWQNAIEEKSLRVNAGKAKIMICEGLYLLAPSRRFSSDVS